MAIVFKRDSRIELNAVRRTHLHTHQHVEDYSDLERMHDSGGYTSHAVTCHSASVTGLSIHPLGNCFVSASMDGTWALHDMTENKCLAHITYSQFGGNTTASVHPDGLLLGMGTANSVITLWDLKQPHKPATQLEAHQDQITCMAFSQNGYGAQQEDALSRDILAELPSDPPDIRQSRSWGTYTLR